MKTKIMALVQAYNERIGELQEYLPVQERYLPDELRQRMILCSPLYEDEGKWIMEIAYKAKNSLQQINYEIANSHTRVLLGRGLIKADMPQPTLRRGEVLQSAWFILNQIVQEINSLAAEATMPINYQESIRLIEPMAAIEPTLATEAMPAIEPTLATEAMPIIESTLAIDPTPATELNPVTMLMSPQNMSSIYQAAPINNKGLCVPSNTDAAVVARLLAETGRVKVYQGDIYVFVPQKHRFRKLNKGEKEVQVMIDNFVKQNGFQLHPREYDEVKKIIEYNSQLRVYQEMKFPGYIWAMANGLYDIRTGVLLESPVQYFYTSNLTCVYDKNAECPTFEHFLYSTAQGNPAIIEGIWRIIGYILSPDISWKAFFVFYGPKDTGKSILSNIIRAFFEPEKVASVSIEEFGNQFSMGRCENCQLITSMDLTDELIPPRSVGKIKNITGGDLIAFEKKGKDAVTGISRAKLLFGSNHMLRTKQPDQAFVERQILIPFLNQVPKEQQNHNLEQELKQELPGIARRAAEAYLRLVADHYKLPTIARAIPKNMQLDDSKVVRKFIEECCDFSDQNARISTEDLHEAYMDFCQRHNLPGIDKTKFSGIFNRQIPQQKTKFSMEGQSLRGYQGVRLRFQRTENAE